MNLQERLIQCNKDIEVLQKQKTEIEQQIKDQELPKFGDIVVWKGDGKSKRVVLRDKNGNLAVFSKENYQIRSFLSNYKRTDETIFDNISPF